MGKTSPGIPTRLGIGLLAAALSVFGIALAGPAGATADVTTDRVAGATRYGTAAAVATEAYPSGNDTVVIATGENFPDALAASGLAGHLDAPVLLTMTNTVPEETSAGINDLGATNATIVGGTAAVSNAVRSALEDHGLTVTRVAGPTRYETAGEVAAEIGDYARAIVASGEVAADALSAGPIAADQQDGPSPILLVQQNNVPAATADALAGVAEVVIAGGTGRISNATAAEVESDSADTDAERVAGLDRQATAHDLAEWEVTNLGWAPATVLLAAPRSPSDDFSPDALVAGPLGGLRDAPVLVIDDPSTLGADAETFLNDHADTIAEIIAIGGTAVIEDGVIADAATAAAFTKTVKTVTNQTFTATPAEAAVNTVSGDSPNANRGVRQYTVSTGDATQVDIQLFPAANVTNTDGVITFADADSNNIADPGAPAGEIAVVNGLGTTGSRANNVTPVNGQVTFTINSDTIESVIPVVYTDSSPAPAGNNGLDLVAPTTANAQPKQPTEAFGIGGQKTWLPEELGQFGTITNGYVLAVNLDEGFYLVDTSGDADPVTAGFQSDGIADVLVRYGTGETYRYTSGPKDLTISMAQFEAWLGAPMVDQSGEVPGDTVSVSNYNPGAGTTHDITNDIPNAPTNVAAAYDATAGAVDITWTPVTNPDRVGYAVARVEVQKDGKLGDPQVVCLFAIVNGDPNASECSDYIDPAARELENTWAAQIGPSLGYAATTPPRGATTYAYVVAAINSSLQNSPISASAVVDIPASADTVDPVVSAITLSDAVPEGAMSTGDQVALSFSEPVQVAAGTTVTVSDGDGTVALIVCGSNATCTQNTARTVLFITLTASPALQQPGTVLGIQYPAEIADVAGITDDVDNELDLAGPTTTLRVGNAPVAQSANFTDGGSEAITDSIIEFGDNVADTITITYNENVFVGAGDTVTVSPGGTTTRVYTCGTNVTCTGTGTPTITLTSMADATTPDVALDGTTDQVRSSNGIVDADNNAPIGYPVAIS